MLTVPPSALPKQSSQTLGEKPSGENILMAAADMQRMGKFDDVPQEPQRGTRKIAKLFKSVTK